MSQFEWNEAKRDDVYQKHGVDLLEAALIFENTVLTKEDTRQDYGEQRYLSLGMVDDIAYVVVHTERDGRIRLITAWKGGQNEREIYEASLT